MNGWGVQMSDSGLNFNQNIINNPNYSPTLATKNSVIPLPPDIVYYCSKCNSADSLEE